MSPRATKKGTTSAAKSAELLLEIGTEELPAQFVAPALQMLQDRTSRLLKEHRLEAGAIRTLGTPRRLTVIVDGLPDRQAPLEREVMGPSRAVAFDAAGQPTKAALGFAGSQGVAVEALEVRQTPKGEYVFAVKREAGRSTAAVLAELLPGLVEGLSFPKAMRWNQTGVRFARPIRWVLAVYAGRVVETTIAGLRAGATTYGHRFLASPTGRRGLTVKDSRSYVATLERHGVIPDPDRRRKMILEQLMSLARSVGGHLHRDEDLLEQAVYSVECPYALVGRFDETYLTLPREILMTAMKEHQGFFSLLQPNGALLPRFIAVTNMKLPNMRLIREGNERVLAARLADAKFYFDEDRKVRLADRARGLEGVTFHQRLGTLAQKTERMVGLAERIAGLLGLPEPEPRALVRAAELAKADLLSGVVGEFPTLQGLMGGEYARHDGEPEAVCRAIAEQYLPKGMEGELPGSRLGLLLSLVDRIDTITAFFHVGMVPSGSEDPLGLRRHAAAIVRLLIEGGLRLDLAALVDDAGQRIRAQGFEGAPGDLRRQVLEFLFERVKFYGRTAHGLREDVMEAVLRPAVAGPADLADLFRRMQALQGVTASPDFDPLMIGFKRAHRLVEKEKWSQDAVRPELFQDSTERELHEALQSVQGQVQEAVARGNYSEALEALVRLKPAIDRFFVGVMVNAEDPALRGNRLSLLYTVDRLFGSVADFSQVAVAGG